MAPNIDFIRRISPEAELRQLKPFGWVATMPEETNALAIRSAATDLSSEVVGVIWGEDEATKFRLSTETDCAPKTLHGWNFVYAVLSHDPDAILIEGSSFKDVRIDRLIFYAMYSGYDCILFGTATEFASSGGKRLLDLMETIQDFEVNGAWWGDNFTEKLEQQARDFIASA